MDKPVQVKCACVFCGREAQSLNYDEDVVLWCSSGHIGVYDSNDSSSFTDKAWKMVYSFELHRRI